MLRIVRGMAGAGHWASHGKNEACTAFRVFLDYLGRLHQCEIPAEESSWVLVVNTFEQTCESELSKQAVQVMNVIVGQENASAMTFLSRWL